MNKLAVYVYPLLVFLFVVPTGATENESEPFRIELTSEPAFRALVQIHRNNPTGVKNIDSLSSLGLAILDDNKIDASERQLLDELISGEHRLLEVVPPSSMVGVNSLLFHNRLVESARQRMGEIQPLTGEWADLDLIWMQLGRRSPFPEWLAMVDAEGIQQQRVVFYLGNRFAEMWQQSGIATAYYPFAMIGDTLAPHYARLPSEDRARVDIIFQQIIELVNPHLTEAQAGPIRWQILQRHMYAQLPQEN